MNANTPLMLMGLVVGTAAASGGHAFSSAWPDRELQAPGSVAKDILGTVQIPRQRLPAHLDQSRRQALPDSLATHRRLRSMTGVGKVRPRGIKE
jgi:hypothetical protein